MLEFKSASVEECPLKTNSNCQKRPQNFKGPIRVIRLCVLGIFLPSLLVALPLYMRYHVYGHQLYPLAMSDMRVLDNKVSTTWCQRQLVKVNTTFNAFLLEKTPNLATHLNPLSMVRHLTLEDDTKEYWGFYLLEGSSVKVSSCVRWPGASLIIIRGHKHLHECAYIGDNSSEELDEMMEAIREQGSVSKENDSAPVNQPNMMKRHQADVKFHHPIHRNVVKNFTLPKNLDDDEITDPKMLKPILESLRTKKKKKEHVHRNSTIAANETENVKIQPPENDHIENTYDDIIKQLESLGNHSATVLEKINKKFKKTNRRKRDIVISNALRTNLTKDDEEENLALEEDLSPDGIADHRGTFNNTQLNDYSNSEFWSSFSSSEEALLNCAGLILNLPLTPHHKCQPDLTDSQAQETYSENTVTYNVPMNGYYFFVFNSENEVQPNYIRVQFHLQKSVYDVTNPVSSCLNSSNTCAMNLKFFSSEKLVMELPVRDNNTLWNEEFIVVSECEPRTAIYAMCVIAVPVLVILFAFS